MVSAHDEQVGGDHYLKMKPQPIEVILAWGMSFPEGCVLKYLARWRVKGALGDLRKARHYLDLLIEHEDSRDLPKWERDFLEKGS